MWFLMDDAQHIKDFLEGNVDALCALVETYRKPLFSFILNMTAGKDDSDEIFQEVWIRAMRALPLYRHRERFSSWLFKIAHRLVIDRVRRKRATVPFDSISDTLDQPHTADHNTPLAALSDSEIGTQIRHAVAGLPHIQREVFLLRMDADLSFKEIARIQKTSINTTLARMSYALDKLRTRLGPVYKELA